VRKTCDRCKKLARVQLVVLEEKTTAGGWLMDMLLCEKCEDDLENLIKRWLKSV
jgi:hypothetical protein